MIVFQQYGIKEIAIVSLIYHIFSEIIKFFKIHYFLIGCFEWPDNLPMLGNNTKHFNKLFNDTINCFINNYNPENNGTVCEKCMQFYLQLDSFYSSLSKDAIGVDSVCMDIVDSVRFFLSIYYIKIIRYK